MRFRLRTLLSSSVILVLLLLLGMFFSQPTIVIENNSNRQITQLHVEIVRESSNEIDDSLNFVNIAPRARNRQLFRWSGADCNVEVEGRFADGRKISGGGGYITSGFQVLAYLQTSWLDACDPP